MKPTTIIALLALAAAPLLRARADTRPDLLRPPAVFTAEDIPVLVIAAEDIPLPLPAATPPPALIQPVIIQQPELTPDNFQRTALQWIGAFAAILTAVTMVLIPAVAVLWSRLKDIGHRQDRQAEKQGQIDGQVRQVLAQAPPTNLTPAAPPPVIPGGSSGKHLQELIDKTTREIIAREKRPGGLLAALALIPLLALAGCSTTGPDAATNARNAGLNAAGKQALSIGARLLTKAATDILVSAVKQEVTGGRADFAQAAAAGLYVNVDAASTVADVKSLAAAYSAGKTMTLANAAARAYAAALDNGVEPPQAIAAIAGVISTATGAPPAK